MQMFEHDKAHVDTETHNIQDFWVQHFIQIALHGKSYKLITLIYILVLFVFFVSFCFGMNVYET
jgi:hypothetical protein